MELKKVLLNRKGNILGVIIIAPFLLYMMLYLILGGSYMLCKNDFNVIINKKLDRALIEGQFTSSIKSELITELNEKGFKKEYLHIEITPYQSNDENDTTYCSRNTEIYIKARYEKPHVFYYVNKFANKFIDEKKFYISTGVSGMSEKW